MAKNSIFSLYNIQKTISALTSEYDEIESEMADIDSKKMGLRRRLNSIEDGIKYLSKLEKEIMKANSKKNKGKK